MSELKVTELVVYPVKSLQGINVDRWPVEDRGLRLDRRWMVVGPDGHFLTARKITKMATIETAFTAGGLRLSREGYGFIDVPFSASGEPAEAVVWDTPVQAVRVAPEAGAWLSEVLAQECSLVYMPDESERPLRAPGAQAGERLGFSDSNPILVASQASIDDLNSRLLQPIPIRRFRPNMVIEGCGPFEEDTWSGVSIGGAELRFSMKSGRCIVTTIDVETGATSDEPLRTLTTYRKDGKHVWFGSFYVPVRLGEVAVGDVVEFKV